MLIIVAAAITTLHLFKESRTLDSIAVIPLENLSGDADLEFIADGITSDLITGLFRLSGFKEIRSRAEMMQFKGRSFKDIEADLDSKVFMAGTVEPTGSSVKIGLELIRADTGEMLWRETYEESLGEIEALINDVTRAVAGAVGVGLTSEETARLASAVSIDPEAYEAYLRGRAFVEMWWDEGFDKSFEYLRRAIEKQSDYAPAYAELVNAYADAHRYGYLVYEEAYPLAEQAITKALELDLESVESQVALGMFRFVFEWDWAGADEAFRHALELDPRNAISHRQYGNFLVHMGQGDASVAEFERARKLAPLSIYINQNLGWAYYHARRYDEALSQLERTKALLEQFPDPHKERQLDRQLLWCYIVKGMHEEAFVKLEELGDWVESDAWDRVWAYVASGRRDEISGMIDTLLRGEDRTDAYYRSTGVHPWTLAVLGETDRAIELLESIYEHHGFHVLFMPISPEYDIIRSDPRFQDLLTRLNLPWQG
jgi:TolB-like protein/Tfp pilus assembly protein PilF